MVGQVYQKVIKKFAHQWHRHICVIQIWIAAKGLFKEANQLEWICRVIPTELKNRRQLDYESIKVAQIHCHFVDRHVTQLILHVHVWARLKFGTWITQMVWNNLGSTFFGACKVRHDFTWRLMWPQRISLFGLHLHLQIHAVANQRVCHGWSVHSHCQTPPIRHVLLCSFHVVSFE